MVTIKDVAKHAGVAFKTVARVVNNDPTVKPENRERYCDLLRCWDTGQTARLR